MAIKKLTKDDKATINMKVDGKVVHVDHTVKTERDSPVRYQLHWALDFSNVKPEDILELAARTITIKLQADWRKSKNQLDEKSWDKVTFDVAGVLADSRRTVDPLTKAANAVQKLSADEKAELLKLLQAK